MRVLLYHEVTEGQPEDFHAVTKAAFTAQISWLRQAGYQSLALSDWLAPAGRAALKPAANSILITFDDGYRDNYTTAWPIMAKYGFSGAIFLVAGRLGQTSDWRPGALGRTPLLAWPEVREMAQAGICFGSHTVSHAMLDRLPQAVAEMELSESREKIEQALGVAVESLAYPYSHFNPQVKAIARQAGYRVAFSCPTDYVGAANKDLYDLRRITALASDQLPDFVAKVRGHWRKRLSWYRRVAWHWRRQRLGLDK